MSIRSPISIDRARRAAIAAVVAVVALSAGGGAEAQPTDAERAMAAALFQEGRALLKEGRIAEACPKLVESQRLDPGGGTLLNVALCHEREGKIATAWVEYREARAVAKRDGRADREEAANEAIQRIEVALSRLTIVVPDEARAPSLAILLDGVDLPAAAWGTKVPINPGAHTVAAQAPGRKPWSISVEIGEGASDRAVTVAPLAEIPVAPPPPVPRAPAPIPAAPPSHAMRTAGYVIGSIGIVGAGVGTGFGIAAISKQSASNELCPATQCSPSQADAIALNQDARTFATVSNIAFGVGLAGLAAGAVLLLVAPGSDAVRVGVALHPDGGAAAVRGAF